MSRTTIEFHTADTPSGQVRYARVAFRHGNQLMFRSVLLKHLPREWRSLIEPDSLGFCWL